MFFEQLQMNPREAVYSEDEWTRMTALVAMAREPIVSDREFFEELVFGEDTTMSLLACVGLRKLFPAPLQTKVVWKEIFSESVDLLTRRACSGPMQLRIAALKALVFAPEHLTFNLVSRILESLESASGHEGIYSGRNRTLPLYQQSHKFFMPEGFGVLLASLPAGFDRVSLLRRELAFADSARVIAALISLQLMPVEELTERVLELARSQDKRVSYEASKALLACGGSKVFLIMLSLFKETCDSQKKALLLPLVAIGARGEVWPIIKNCAFSEDRVLAKAAINAANLFAVSLEDRVELFREAMKNSDSSVACLAAVYAWKCGSMKAIRLIRKNFESEVWQNRLAAAKSLSEINSEISFEILLNGFERERNGDVLREIVLSIRRLIKKSNRGQRIPDVIFTAFGRLLKSADPFKRSQCAVMCGLVGRPCEELVIGAAEHEEHPHVLASLLTALGKCGCDKMLVYSRFHDHEDARVRANMISSMPLKLYESSAYFTEAAKDECSRVRATASEKLFMLGQLDAVNTLNRMLLVPDPVSVLSGCYALSRILRIQIPLLKEDHPISLSVSRKCRIRIKTKEFGPIILNTPEIAVVFNEMAIAGGNRHKLLWLLEEQNRKYPSSYPIRRMLSSLLAIDGQYERALEILDLCLSENPGSLADLLDAYRISLRLCDLPRASNYGEKAKKLYSTLLSACIQLCTTVRGRGADFMMKKLHHLNEPSMNLYNAMIQLKAVEKDNATVLDLLSELLLSRPFNSLVVRKLASMLPESFSDLRRSLEVYASSLPVTVIGI